MPNRILKESICTSDEINSLSTEGEVFFYRLMVNCDDFGRLDARQAIIKSKCYPLKSIDSNKIQSLVDELIGVNLIGLYLVNNKPFIYLKSWSDHQQIRAQKSKYPSVEDGFEINCYQMITTAIKCPRNTIQYNPIQSNNTTHPSDANFIDPVDNSKSDDDDFTGGYGLSTNDHELPNTPRTENDALHRLSLDVNDLGREEGDCQPIGNGIVGKIVSTIAGSLGKSDDAYNVYYVNTTNSITDRNNTTSEKSEDQPEINKKINKNTKQKNGYTIAELLKLSPGLDEQKANDWMIARRRKPVTQSIFNSLSEQGALAGMTVAQVITLCAENGWQSFKASWLNVAPGIAKSMPPQNANTLTITNEKIFEMAEILGIDRYTNESIGNFRGRVMNAWEARKKSIEDQKQHKAGNVPAKDSEARATKQMGQELPDEKKMELVGNFVNQYKTSSSKRASAH